MKEAQRLVEEPGEHRARLEVQPEVEGRSAARPAQREEALLLVEEYVAVAEVAAGVVRATVASSLRLAKRRFAV